jgi:hypothetical protein
MSIEWDGTGPPSVGVVCEYRSDKWPEGLWEKRTVRYVSDYHVITAEEDGIERSVPAAMAKFRPIRTPEQAEMEERDHASFELAGIIAGHDQHIAVRDIEMAKYLYDIGYRKQVQP